MATENYDVSGEKEQKVIQHIVDNIIPYGTFLAFTGNVNIIVEQLTDEELDKLFEAMLDPCVQKNMQLNAELVYILIETLEPFHDQLIELYACKLEQENHPAFIQLFRALMSSPKKYRDILWKAIGILADALELPPESIADLKPVNAVPETKEMTALNFDNANVINVENQWTILVPKGFKVSTNLDEIGEHRSVVIMSDDDTGTYKAPFSATENLSALSGKKILDGNAKLTDPEIVQQIAGTIQMFNNTENRIYNVKNTADICVKYYFREEHHFEEVPLYVYVANIITRTHFYQMQIFLHYAASKTELKKRVSEWLSTIEAYNTARKAVSKTNQANVTSDKTLSESIADEIDPMHPSDVMLQSVQSDGIASLFFENKGVDYCITKCNVGIPAAPYHGAETAWEYAKVFRVDKETFSSDSDRLAEIQNCYIKNARYLSALRSFAWSAQFYAENHFMSCDDLDTEVLLQICDFVEERNCINYIDDYRFSALCGVPDGDTAFLPISSDDPRWERACQYAGTKHCGELSVLRHDLDVLAKAIEKLHNYLLRNRTNCEEPLEGIVSDILYAWCVLSLACSDSFKFEDGPSIYELKVKEDFSNFGLSEYTSLFEHSAFELFSSDFQIDVVGTGQDGRAGNHECLSVGDRVLLQREPNNAYDSNAIVVHSLTGKMLGYIPKGKAAEMAPCMDDKSVSFSAEVAKTVPLSQRSTRAKNPLLTITVKTDFYSDIDYHCETKEQNNSVQNMKGQEENEVQFSELADKLSDLSNMLSETETALESAKTFLEQREQWEEEAEAKKEQEKQDIIRLGKQPYDMAFLFFILRNDIISGHSDRSDTEFWETYEDIFPLYQKEEILAEREKMLPVLNDPTEFHKYLAVFSTAPILQKAKRVSFKLLSDLDEWYDKEQAIKYTIQSNKCLYTEEELLQVQKLLADKVNELRKNELRELAEFDENCCHFNNVQKAGLLEIRLVDATDDELDEYNLLQCQVGQTIVKIRMYTSDNALAMEAYDILPWIWQVSPQQIWDAAFAGGRIKDTRKEQTNLEGAIAQAKQVAGERIITQNKRLENLLKNSEDTVAKETLDQTLPKNTDPQQISNENAKQSKYNQLLNDKKYQEWIVANNKGWFGKSAKARKAAKIRLAQIEAELKEMEKQDIC